MKDISLKELQSLSIAILDDVHKFCIENKIAYSLAYGTLIGAIRHRGFIPWDDDIDIMMTRPNYDRFCKEYAGRYKLICHENTPNCLIGFARVCEMEKTFVRQATWCMDHTGVWIDVFPIDSAPDRFEDFTCQYLKAQKIFSSMQIHRNANKRVSFEYPLRTNIKTIVLRSLFLGGVISRLKIEKMIQIAKRIPYGETNHCAQMGCLDNGTNEYLLREDFEKYIMVRFEGKEYMAISGYDRVLKSVFGDYMKLPPKEEQVPKQDYLRFLWK